MIFAELVQEVAKPRKGALNIIGELGGFAMPKLPQAAPNFVALIRLVAPLEHSGALGASVHIEAGAYASGAPAGTVIRPPEERMVTVPPDWRSELQRYGMPIRVGLIFPITGLVFPAYGRYDVVVNSGERELGRAPFVIEPVEADGAQ